MLTVGERPGFITFEQIPQDPVSLTFSNPSVTVEGLFWKVISQENSTAISAQLKIHSVTPLDPMEIEEVTSPSLPREKRKINEEEDELVSQNKKARLEISDCIIELDPIDLPSLSKNDLTKVIRALKGYCLQNEDFDCNSKLCWQTKIWHLSEAHACKILTRESKVEITPQILSELSEFLKFPSWPYLRFVNLYSSISEYNLHLQEAIINERAKVESEITNKIENIKLVNQQSNLKNRTARSLNRIGNQLHKWVPTYQLKQTDLDEIFESERMPDCQKRIWHINKTLARKIAMQELKLPRCSETVFNDFWNGVTQITWPYRKINAKYQKLKKKFPNDFKTKFLAYIERFDNELINKFQNPPKTITVISDPVFALSPSDSDKVKLLKLLVITKLEKELDNKKEYIDLWLLPQTQAAFLLNVSVTPLSNAWREACIGVEWPCKRIRKLEDKEKEEAIKSTADHAIKSVKNYIQAQN